MRIFITEATLASIYKKQTRSGKVPDNIATISKKILTKEFSEYANRLSQDINAIPFVANLANLYAKRGLTSYEYKTPLLTYLIITNDNAWCRKGDDTYMYVDTEYGTFGFHIYDNQYEIAQQMGKLKEKQRYKGFGNQGKAVEFLKTYIKDNYE